MKKNKFLTSLPIALMGISLVAPITSCACNSQTAHAWLSSISESKKVANNGEATYYIFLDKDTYKSDDIIIKLKGTSSRDLSVTWYVNNNMLIVKITQAEAKEYNYRFDMIISTHNWTQTISNVKFIVNKVEAQGVQVTEEQWKEVFTFLTTIRGANFNFTCKQLSNASSTSNEENEKIFKVDGNDECVYNDNSKNDESNEYDTSLKMYAIYRINKADNTKEFIAYSDKSSWESVTLFTFQMWLTLYSSHKYNSETHEYIADINMYGTPVKSTVKFIKDNNKIRLQHFNMKVFDGTSEMWSDMVFSDYGKTKIEKFELINTYTSFNKDSDTQISNNECEEMLSGHYHTYKFKLSDFTGYSGQKLLVLKMLKSDGSSLWANKLSPVNAYHNGISTLTVYWPPQGLAHLDVSSISPDETITIVCNYIEDSSKSSPYKLVAYLQ